MLKDELFSVLSQSGAQLMGVGNLAGIVPDGLTVGVSVAVPVPPHIVRQLQSAPTVEYYRQYFELNARLNAIVEAGARFLRDCGYRAVANTTDAVKKDENWCTPLPHKTVATRAGIGWIGKSCLLVTPQYGSAVRLSSIVTDAPLPFDKPIDASRCGDCTVCVDSCPAGALKGALWEVGMPREQLLDRFACKETQIERMERATGIKTDLCGKCFAVCPYTQGYLKRAERG